MLGSVKEEKYIGEPWSISMDQLMRKDAVSSSVCRCHLTAPGGNGVLGLLLRANKQLSSVFPTREGKHPYYVQSESKNKVRKE